MKLGLGTSTALHAGLLAWALVSIGAPEPLDEAVVESLPVEIIPLEEFAQLVKGEEEAPKLDAPAPTPTLAEPVVEDAVNVGETDADVEVADAPDIAPRPVDATPVASTPDPQPTTDPFEVADVPAPADRPERPSAPTTEIATVAEPEAPVAPDPVETAEVVPEAANEPQSNPITDAIESADLRSDPVEALVEKAAEAASELRERTAEPEADVAPTEPEPPRFAALPTDGPKALARPPRARPARTPERREETAVAVSSPTEQGERRVTDEIAALLNREEPAAGGAQRQATPASLGGSRTTAATLTRSEMDGLKKAIQRCWSPPAGTSDAASLVVKVRMQLDASGRVEGRPEVVSSPGGAQGRAAEGAAVRAMLRCGPYNLPSDKYETWATVEVNFDPRDMF